MLLEETVKGAGKQTEKLFGDLWSRNCISKVVSTPGKEMRLKFSNSHQSLAKGHLWGKCWFSAHVHTAAQVAQSTQKLRAAHTEAVTGIPWGVWSTNSIYSKNDLFPCWNASTMRTGNWTVLFTDSSTPAQCLQMPHSVRMCQMNE